MSASRLKRSQRRERRTAARAVTRPNLCDTLLAVWRHARWVFLQFCDFHAAPRALAEREWIATHEYKGIEAWLRAIELLTRRLVLAAALALNVVLKPPPQRAHAEPRRRRRVLVWLQKPETWIARFRMFLKKPPEVRVIYRNTRDVPRVMRSFPLARRLEAMRRVLADPDPRVHRLAVKLARLRASNAKANSPRLFAAREWDSRKAITRGKRLICTGMELVMPLVHNRLDAFNQACEPG
jgi:hypothetical protein